MALDDCPRVPRGWYLAQLKAGGHVRATENLHRQGFRTFMPMREVTQRRAGRLETARRALFPGYLFVQATARSRPWQSINSTYGVGRLVAFGRDAPAELPEALMTGLFARVAADDALMPCTDLRVGERVRIVAGPFAAFLARVESIPEKGRIFALLDLMGRTVRAEVSPMQVERL